MLTACDCFFAIHELVSVFLHQADTLVLLNCQRVCRLWKDIIDQSEIIQQHLFLVPAPPSGDGESEVELNPILKTHFDPLLGWQEEARLFSMRRAFRTSSCEYADLQKLPWARDGIDADALARKAFARKEASWRKMLISQPPMERLDWWHEWETTTQNNHGKPQCSGQGHRPYNGVVTIGTLWDLLEARLLRECSVSVTFYVAGCRLGSDPESHWSETLGSNSRHMVVDANLPRVRVRSHQRWPGAGPEIYNRFNVPSRKWEIFEEPPVPIETRQALRNACAQNGDGMAWLCHDCEDDTKDSHWRWSRSDGFEELKYIGGGSSGHGGNRLQGRLQQRERLVREFEERAKGQQSGEGSQSSS